MQSDIESIHKAIEHLRWLSVSSNGSGNAPCTVEDLKNLRDNIANALETIVNNLDN